ncbi:MAG TPA: glycosyltransferase family 39 protein [Acetobacteraceae bacterium]|nr:glycosyltransferase family 39 protein [Acetobacteraceae bacterium]
MDTDEVHGAKRIGVHPGPSVVFNSCLWLILVATVLRLGFGAALGLGVDESYMVASGRVMSLGYFDHPPAAWWLSWGAAHLFGSEAPVIVRLPFIGLFALSTWLMYRLGGFWAALLLNLSPVFGVTTGTWVLPDGPLDCALLAATLCLMRALERGTLGWWLGAGLCAGLALFSKYSAVLTLAGAGGFLLTSPQHRRLLAGSKPWLGLVVAALVFSPVLVWNAQHGWASFAFQGGRAEGLRFHPFAPLATLGGEALFVLPWIWAPMMVLWIARARRGPAEWRSWLLCWLAAPPILVFALIAAWSSQRVLFHWAAPGYLMLFPLLGHAVAQRIGQPPVPRLIWGTAGFVVLAVLVVATQVRFDWLPLAQFARRDPDIEAVDWTSLRAELALKPGALVGVPNWRDAGKVAYALGPDVTTICLNRDARQFGYAVPAGHFVGRDMLILAPEHGERVPQELGSVFEAMEPLAPVPVRHAGHTLFSVAVFRASHLRAWPPPG